MWLCKLLTTDPLPVSCSLNCGQSSVFACVSHGVSGRLFWVEQLCGNPLIQGFFKGDFLLPGCLQTQQSFKFRKINQKEETESLSLCYPSLSLTPLFLCYPSLSLCYPSLSLTPLSLCYPSLCYPSLSLSPLSIAPLGFQPPSLTPLSYPPSIAPLGCHPPSLTLLSYPPVYCPSRLPPPLPALHLRSINKLPFSHFLYFTSCSSACGVVPVQLLLQIRGAPCQFPSLWSEPWGYLKKSGNTTSREMKKYRRLQTEVTHLNNQQKYFLIFLHKSCNVYSFAYGFYIMFTVQKINASISKSWHKMENA